MALFFCYASLAGAREQGPHNHEAQPNTDREALVVSIVVLVADQNADLLIVMAVHDSPIRKFIETSESVKCKWQLQAESTDWSIYRRR